MIRAMVVGWLLALDGGVALKPDASQPAPKALSAEDLEVVKNLELLENMESSSDLELLQELSLDR
jgi:hypothetical protein